MPPATQRLDETTSDTVTNTQENQDKKKDVTRRRLVWADECVAEVITIPSLAELEDGQKSNLWYKKEDFRSFEQRNFEVFGDFREVFRGARIDQCEEWFISQRGDSLRGLETLELGIKRHMSVVNTLGAVFDEQIRQKSKGKIDMDRLGEISRRYSSHHVVYALQKGNFDADLVQRAHDRDMRKSKSRIPKPKIQNTMPNNRGGKQKKKSWFTIRRKKKS
uniref:Uncharacterized protein n=1 Tax=Leptocylindrus danicus TaxID=163516 RepID=A0A7S2LL24_9STRA